MSGDLAYWREQLCSDNLAKLLQFLNENHDLNQTQRTLKIKERFPSFSAVLSNLALDTYTARGKIKNSSNWSSKGYFLRDRLEQASSPLASQHHALSFKDKNVLEVGCGLGFDTALIAEKAKHVTAIDNDPLCCAICEYNLKIQGINNVTIVCDDAELLLTEKILSEYDAIWADPGRRTADGTRIRNAQNYLPSLDIFKRLNFDGLIGIKVSPALNIWDLGDNWAHEFIGIDWNCPEQILWKNSQHRGSFATLIDKNQTWRSAERIEMQSICQKINIGSYLIEPHPALVRTQHIEGFYIENQLIKIDPYLAYGLSHQKPAASHWFRCYHIIDNFKFCKKNLKKKLTLLNWDSRTQIKKRGVEEDPDKLHASLKLPKASNNSEWGYIIILKIGNTPEIVITEKI